MQIIEPSGYYLKVKECHRKACPGNDCAAALVAFLIWFHNGKQRTIEYAQMTNAALKARGLDPIADETTWQFHTDEQLNKRVMFWRVDTIAKAILYLKEKNFISTDAPENLKQLYKTGRTKWFKVNVEVWNKFVIENYGASLISELTENFNLQDADARKEKEKLQMEAAHNLFLFWKTVMNHPQTLADSKRIQRIIARIKDGKTELELATAIIGNKHSKFHQADHPNNQVKIYDAISIIFRDAEQVENFITFAETAGFTAEKAEEFYRRILAETEKGPLPKNSAEAVKLKTVSVADYEKLARTVKRLVIDEKKTFEKVVEYLFTFQAEMKINFLDLRDSETLTALIVEMVEAQEVVTETRKNKIKEFTERLMNRLRGKKE